MTLTLLSRAGPDYARMVEALAAAGLPTSDLDEGHAEYFTLADSAFGGIARHGAAGLLRSIVVPADRRGHGTGSALLAALTDHARGVGIGDLWLLTTGAEPFFARHDFRTANRDEAPEAIANTRQFRDLCPASAVLMHKRLA
ncbi:MAG TPA: arsenic resistance N-acetyltransferase ArsN2 [Rhizomicrobium sp.]|jgi:amino-acid N-acetyltransferase|nr:arsenic resistance N-acetyltransferase ArsN2 [Rhizomicrobium sp.]